MTPDSSTISPDTAASGPEGTGRPGPRRTIVRAIQILGLTLVAASYGIWVYVYSGSADRPTPDMLDSAAFSGQAEPLCAAALADLADLPQAYDATSGPERAAQVRAATARLEVLVADLEPLVAGSGRDVAILTEWLEDWKVMIGDRYRYAEALMEDPATRYLMTDTGVGERLDRRVTRLATTNKMTSCGTPQDVG